MTWLLQDLMFHGRIFWDHFIKYSRSLSKKNCQHQNQISESRGWILEICRWMRPKFSCLGTWMLFCSVKEWKAINPTMKHGDRSMMMWGCLLLQEHGILTWCMGLWKKEEYVDTVKNIVKKSMEICPNPFKNTNQIHIFPLPTQESFFLKDATVHFRPQI